MSFDEDTSQEVIEPTAEAQHPSIGVEDELGSSFMDYSMSVIMSRALPDVRDGLKPVHRRIVYMMKDGGYSHNRSHSKSARIVGDVMGKLHPHGDSAIYDAMVRMAQDWSMRLPLVDGQGNFGSVDGDAPAAMRYTEARMSRAAADLVADIDKDTVDFRDNYDGTTQEPVVLPTRLPNILINGAQGIAVGMATMIPPHNPSEVIGACLEMINRPEMTTAELMEIIPGPDFPTGGHILGRGGIYKAYGEGRGSIRISGVYEIKELKGGRSRIEITELPYSVVKERLVQQIAEKVKEEAIVGVSDIRDSSDRKGMCIQVDVRRDADPNVVVAQLRKHTRLVETFGVNTVVLDPTGRPRVMTLHDILTHFLKFRREVIRRRTIFELNEARDRLHIVTGLYAAVSRIDEVVAMIRGSASSDEARTKLLAMPFSVEGPFAELIAKADPDKAVGETFYLSDIQAKAILDMRLSKLTGLEREKIAEEARELADEVSRCLNILNNRPELDAVLKAELEASQAQYSTGRRTLIEDNEADDIDAEDLIERRDVVITRTREGYVKRTNLDSYRAQRRGGKGKSGMETKDDDIVVSSTVATTHTPLVFFTSRGIAHKLKAWKLPEKQASARGKPLINYLPLEKGELIQEMIPMPEENGETDGKFLVFVTNFGTVRRNEASEFTDIRANGKIAMKLEDDDGKPMGTLKRVLLCEADDDLLLSTKHGMTARYKVSEIRVFQSRNSIGVRGMRLADGDEIIDASIVSSTDASPNERAAYLAGGKAKVYDKDSEQEMSLNEGRMAEMATQDQMLLTVTEKGMGKISSSHHFSSTSRGVKGIRGMRLTNKSGNLIACLPVEKDDEIILVTDAGQTIRMSVDSIRVCARDTQGVKLLSLNADQKIVAVARAERDS